MADRVWQMATAMHGTDRLTLEHDDENWATWEGKAKSGRLRGQVRPDLKRQAEELVKRDARFGSVSRLMGVSLAYYFQEYERAHGNIDPQCFPIVPCSSSNLADT